MGYLCANFSLPIGVSVLELGPMYATNRQTDVRQQHRLMPPPYGGGGITTEHGCEERQTALLFTVCSDLNLTPVRPFSHGMPEGQPFLDECQQGVLQTGFYLGFNFRGGVTQNQGSLPCPLPPPHPLPSLPAPPLPLEVGPLKTS